MLVERAVFTSLPNARLKGYHLVSQSPGVDSRLARLLVQWCPSHASLYEDSPGAESTNFHQLGEGWYAVSRTVHGEPEHSSRGGLQVVTFALVLRQQQFDAYDRNPLAIVNAARARGLLRYTGEFPSELPPAELPDFSAVEWAGERTATPWEPRYDRVRELLDTEQRVAVLGVEDPSALLDGIVRVTPVRARSRLGFTTGLLPSRLRPFRLHVVPQGSQVPERRFTTLGIRCVRCN